MQLNNNWMKLYVKSDGKFFEIVHICHSTKEVNKYCLDKIDCSLIATDSAGLNYIVNNKPAKQS